MEDNKGKVEALQNLLMHPGWKIAVDHYAGEAIESLRDELEGLEPSDEKGIMMTQGKITLIKEFFGYRHGEEDYQEGAIVTLMKELDDGSKKD